MSSSTSDTNPKQTKFVFRKDRQWRHGFSYYVEDGVNHVLFACRTCDKELESYGIHHFCWHCMAKYCAKCWEIHEGYAACPNDDGDPEHWQKEK